MAETAETPSILAQDAEVQGTIRTAGNLRIDGKVEGEIHCGGDLVVGKTAVIQGNMEVNSISIAGALTGNVTARDRIEMKSTARVNGDIKAKRLAVEDGVTFIGRSEVNPSGQAKPQGQGQGQGGQPQGGQPQGGQPQGGAKGEPPPPPKK